MRIVYIASVRIPNEKASGLAIMRQCDAFSALKHEVVLLRPKRNNHITEDPFIFYGIKNNFSIKTLGSFDFVDKVGNFGFYVTRLSQMVTSFLYLVKHKTEIDLIYARDPWMLLFPVVFLKNKKIIWEAHQKQSGYFVNFVALRVNRVVCISRGLKEYYEDCTGRSDIFVEPSGVNLDQFKDLPSVQEVRKFLGIPSNKKVIGYIGKYTTMGDEKGVDELIQVFSNIYKDFPDIHLLIVGLEPLEIDSIGSICRGCGISDTSFTLLPLIQKDFALYIQASDILVMNYPSTDHYAHYMSPTKLFAYMAGGKIVVASDLPTVREIADESMIFFVTPGDQKSLESAFLLALKEGSYIDVMKKNASSKAQKYSWLNRASRILA